MNKHFWSSRLRLLVASAGFLAVVVTGVAVAGEDMHNIPQARVQARRLADSSVSQQNGAFATRVAIDVPRFHGITP